MLTIIFWADFFSSKIMKYLLLRFLASISMKPPTGYNPYLQLLEPNAFPFSLFSHVLTYSRSFHWYLRFKRLQRVVNIGSWKGNWLFCVQMLYYISIQSLLRWDNLKERKLKRGILTQWVKVRESQAAHKSLIVENTCNIYRTRLSTIILLSSSILLIRCFLKIRLKQLLRLGLFIWPKYWTITQSIQRPTLMCFWMLQIISDQQF